MNQPKDHWSILAEQVGAELPPEPQASQAHPPAPAPSSAAVRPRNEPIPPPKRPAGDWNQLAASLGIEVAAEPSKPVSAPKPKQEPKDPVTAPVASVSPPTPAAKPASRRSEDRERVKGRERRSRPPRVTEEAVELDWAITSPPLVPEQPAEAVLPPGIADAAESRDAEAVEPGLEAEVGDAPGDAIAESLFEPTERKSGRRRRRRRRGGRKNARSNTAEQAHSEDSSTPDEVIDAGAADADEVLSEVLDVDLGDPAETAAVELPRLKRRRRRRRSGSKKNGARAADSGVATESDASLEGELDEEFAARDAARKPRSSDAAASDDAEDDDDDTTRDAAPGGSRSSARDIPSWQDAIGVIVAANMESRAKSPRNGNQRGRGRGQGSRSRSHREGGGE